MKIELVWAPTRSCFEVWVTKKKRKLKGSFTELKQAKFLMELYHWMEQHPDSRNEL